MDTSGNVSHSISGGLGALLAQGARRLGHAPFLTFYGDDSGEQTELSYATFDNWVSKTANLLTEELGARRGSRVRLQVVAHWTGAVIAAAAWKVGAVVVVGDNASDSDDLLVVAENDAAGVGHDRLVVVGAGMAGRVSGDPPGVHFGDEVLAFADDYDDPAVSVDDVAVVAGATAATSGEMLREASLLLPPGGRGLSTAALASRRGLIEVLAAPIYAGGSIVWCPDAASEDLSGRADEERVTHVLGDTEPT